MATEAVLSKLAVRLRRGERLVSAWCCLGDPAAAEVLVREGYDTAVLDMQHGTFTVDSAIEGIALLALAGKPAVVRVPVGEFATASRMLDAGAAAVVAPMINSAADAKAFAAFAKYPPLGDRSWGPGRAIPLSGLDPVTYLAQANATQLALPMIETRAALDALDDILAVPGIDGVLVGPADLSIALLGGRLDAEGPEVEAALDHIAARAAAAGKVACLFCMDGARARAMGARGFGLCSASIDTALLRQGAARELATAR